ncbi:hypothetical protein HIM_00187 [Hirsutella minnesotensis 3608]|nr:hypothetical protein HIM_00187 [Hirsutella minnesotensis 3608]
MSSFPTDVDTEMKVIIVGGSIAGLSLAHCLEKAKIEYILLEQKDDLCPQEGASIGVMPNGGRILEQLGLYDRVEELIEPLTTAHVIYPDGFHYTSQYPALLQQRFGYPLAFLDRQKLLEILADAPTRSGRVRLGCKIVDVESDSKGVSVKTADGQLYHGDLVIGADGIHSRVRAQMWRLASESQGKAKFKDEYNDMTISYSCIFGISSPIEKLEPGTQLTCYNDGYSILTVVGQNGRVFWFLFLKLEETHIYRGSRNDAWRFTSADAEAHCQRLAQEPVWNDVTFGQVWSRCEVYQMTALEEGLFSQWHWDKIVCIGDSMHKVSSSSLWRKGIETEPGWSLRDFLVMRRIG